MIKRARNYAEKLLKQKKYKNDSTGYEIYVGMKGVKHTLSTGAQKDLISSIASIPDILKRAHYLGDAPDDYNKNVLKNIYLGVKIKTDKGVKDIVVVVKEYSDGKRYYDHSFEK